MTTIYIYIPVVIYIYGYRSIERNKIEEIYIIYNIYYNIYT